MTELQPRIYQAISIVECIFDRATARPQPPKAEAQKAEAKTPADKRKSLLQDVRLS